MSFTNINLNESKNVSNNYSKNNGNIKHKARNKKFPTKNKFKMEKKLGLNNLKNPKQFMKVVNKCIIYIFKLKK